MKRTFLIFVALAALLFVGCTTRSSIAPRTADGKPYDIVVVCPNDAWHGALAMAVCDMLEEDVPGLTRPQGYFNIVKQTDERGLTDIDRRCCNVLRLSIDPAYVTPSTSVAYNVYARPQTIVVVKAPSAEVATRYVESSAAALRDIFERAERETSNNYYRAAASEQLMADFKAHTGIEMVIPNNYYKATTRDKELLWYIRDYTKKAQYIFAYSYDYTSKEDLSPEWIMRSIANRLYTIPGELAGSYMGVNEDGPAIVADIEVNGRKWRELRGWWEVKGDFMGGPFVSYTTLDEANGRLTTILFALYAPEEGQRSPLRELEHLIYTAK